MKVKGSLRRQLIIGISLVHAVLMMIFVYDLLSRQKSFLRDESVRLVSGLAQALAANSSSWLLSRDYSGLQEVVMGQTKYPNLVMAMVFANDGKVLAHTDISRIGLYVERPQFSQTAPKSVTGIEIIEGERLISAIGNIESQGEVIGIVWVTLNMQGIYDSLKNIAMDGILYILFSILVGGGLAIIVVVAFTKDLNQLMRVANAIKRGERNQRVHIRSQDELGQLGDAFDAMLDALEQKEASLVHAKMQANSANKAKGEFLANMSHEIRTPINAIIGIADVLAETPLTDEQKKYVQIFQRAGENLISLVNDILDFSKIEAGELKIVKTWFSMGELFDDVRRLSEGSAKQQGLLLNFELQTNFPEFLKGDSNRIRQVLLNLVSNAIKFTPRGHVRVRGRLESHDERLLKVNISVEDTGIGIAEEALPYLFERFRQLDSSPSRKVGGSGLGLAISKRFVELMGGKIQCQSQLGTGTTLSFFIPFLKEEISTRQEVEAEADIGCSDNVIHLIRQPRRLLLVDDSEENRLLIKAFLKNQPIEITECENGEQAIVKFKNGKYDLVLLDMQMPVLDGYQTVEAMRRWEDEHQLERTKIFALSADSLPDLIDRALLAGCDFHISKPVRKKSLLEVLDFNEAKNFKN